MGPSYKNGEKPYLKCTMIGLFTLPIQELKTKILFILSYSCYFFNNDYDLNSSWIATMWGGSIQYKTPMLLQNYHRKKIETLAYAKITSIKQPSSTFSSLQRNLYPLHKPNPWWHTLHNIVVEPKFPLQFHYSSSLTLLEKVANLTIEDHWQD